MASRVVLVSLLLTGSKREAHAALYSQDLPASLLLLLAAIIPLSLLALAEIIAPLVYSLLPTSITSALREPSDGSLPADDAEATTSTYRRSRRGRKAWALILLGAGETIAWSVGAVLVDVKFGGGWREALTMGAVASGWVSPSCWFLVDCRTGQVDNGRVRWGCDARCWCALQARRCLLATLAASLRSRNERARSL